MLEATSICIFTGVMDATLYVNILTQHLLPFIQIKQNFIYGIEHRFMQDNDPKHCSRMHIARQLFEDNNINRWKPLLNHQILTQYIENLWHELKYLRARVKPRTQFELVEGIKSFWSTVDRAMREVYIRHLY